MSRIIIEATYIEPNVCFECGAPATERHHIVPASLGGTKTIPLCGVCHAKVHSISGQRRNQLGELTKNSLLKRKELIETQGGFYSRSGKWVTKLGPGKGHDTSKAIAAAALAKTNERLEWIQNSPAVKLAKERIEQGFSRIQILEELGNLWELDPKQWGTREGSKVSKGVLSKWLNEGSAKKQTKTTELDIVEKKVVRNVSAKKSRELSDNTLKAIKAYAQTQREKKQEWLLNSDACNYVRELYDSYKTRYLIASEKIELFNRQHVLMNGKKINSTGQWSQLKDELGFRGIVTGTSEKINFLYQWAHLCLEKMVECRVIKRNNDYLIMPTNIIVAPAQIHLWNNFFNGLKVDGVIDIKFDKNHQVVYVFASNEIIEKIVRDMEGITDQTFFCKH